VGVPRLLDLFQRRQMRTSWFVPGHSIETFPEQFQRIVDEGHEIGLHGWRHRYMFTSSPRIARCLAAISDVVGAAQPRPRWFRPPYGVLSATAALEAARHGLAPILWTTWAKDWRADATAESVHALLEPGLVGGATLMLHDSSTTRAPMSWTATAGALPALLRVCADRGLRVGPLREHGLG
jgi:peptidoglycan/xylan/chitin deacetylase (PgdA/CDA1 family)